MGQVVSQFIADYGELLVEGVRDTIIMTAVATLLAYVIGLPVGVLLITSAKKGIRPNAPLNTVLGWIVNIVRSVPFIILLVAIIPLTRLIVGTSLGVPGDIVPLVITAAPFVARVVEQSLAEVDGSLVEAAQSFGASNLQIVFKVLLFESLPSLVRGAALTFITLPKVFASMGVGTIVGIAFFLMFLFAALTSAISLLETSVSTLNDELHWSRGKCCLLMVVVMLVIGTASSFGYGIWDSVKILGMQFLDFFDFLTNSVMMPIAALATCILILKVVGFKRMDAEIEQSSDFKRKKLYHFFLKYLASACVIIILLSSIANVLGWISM